MAKGNKAPPVGTSGVMHVLETKILRPAIYFILAGSFVRVSAVAFNSTYPYTAWPLLIQLAVDVTVVLGTVGCADIMFNISCSRARRTSSEIDALNNSEDFRPNPAWSARRFQQQSEVLKAKLAQAIKGKVRERWEQIAIAALCGFIMLVFGSAFEWITLNRLTLVGTVIGFITTFALLPLQYAVFAVYREIHASPAERADQITDEALEAALEGARERVKNGTATAEDLDLLHQASSNQFNRGMLRLMRKRDTTKTYLTTVEVYATYSITDPSGQAQIRRRISEAGEKSLRGVIKDTATDKWITPVDALGYLFPQEFIDRLRANALRKNSASGPKSQAALGEQDSSSVRAGESRDLGAVLARMLHQGQVGETRQGEAEAGAELQEASRSA